MEWKRNSSSTADQQLTEMGTIVRQFQAMSLDSDISRLPQEILAEILLRLPVKSLLNCRCVSKSWLSLISSPNFIKTHLQNSTKIRSITDHRIMLTIYDKSDHFLDYCSLHSLLINPVSDAITIDSLMKFPFKSVRLVGSCNGLVFMVVGGIHLYLWNPTIRKAKLLRDSGMGMKSDRLFQYGFGFDEANDDYKVVEICFDFENKIARQAIVMVYSLITDSWKRIGDLEGYFTMGRYFTMDTYVFRMGPGTFVNGKLHWLRSLSKGCTSNDIVSLDLETELYGTIEQPNGHSEPTLDVLGACLCVLRSNWTNGDLWILKEYGVNESWTKIFKIPYMDDPTTYPEIRPLYMLNNGEVLLSFGTFFAVFNPKDRSLRYPIINNSNYCLDAKIFVESLVSPIAADRLGGQY